MNNYWAGVFTGLCCSIIFTCVLCYSSVQEVRKLKTQQLGLEQRQQVLEDWYEENKTVMQTYKFFNQSWQAIIDLHNHEKKED